MAKDYSLKDPPLRHWDPLFRCGAGSIDGILKVAGSDRDEAEKRLTALKKALGLEQGIISEIAGASPPTTVASRIDGKVRPIKPRGKEQYVDAYPKNLHYSTYSANRRGLSASGSKMAFRNRC